MDLAKAREIISEYVRETFGKVVELREIAIRRSSTGRVWAGRLYCVTRSGDVEVGRVGVAEDGRVTGGLTVDGLIEALTRVHAVGAGGEALEAPADAFGAEDSFSDIGLDTWEDEPLDSTPVGSDIEDVFAGLDAGDLKERVSILLSSPERSDWYQARETMPQLLADPEERGEVLRQMGELELRLGNNGIALEHLQAAARELGDRADLAGLERVVALAAAALGDQELARHPIKQLFDQLNSKLNPVPSLGQVPAFLGLGDEEMFELAGAGDPIAVSAGEDVLKEGHPAVRAFVIKSGILEVRLETEGGGTRLVRCCFPGEFVGETSVLGEPGATCSATVRAKVTASLWRFEGERLRQICRDLPDLRARIEAARTLHRLDSFFSMNEATGTLDARVRDRLLSCITAFRHVRNGEVLSREGAPPEAVFLLADGRVEYRRPGAPSRMYGPDMFCGLSDTLHELPLEGDLVAVEPCKLVVFDGESLKRFAAAAPPEVVAVIERLE